MVYRSLNLQRFQNFVNLKSTQLQNSWGFLNSGQQKHVKFKELVGFIMFYPMISEGGRIFEKTIPLFEETSKRSLQHNPQKPLQDPGLWRESWIIFGDFGDVFGVGPLGVWNGFFFLNYVYFVEMRGKHSFCIYNSIVEATGS